MKASHKASAINKLLNRLTGDDRQASIALGFCVKPPIGCGNPVSNNSFKDEEFTISGLCQGCQDKFFG